MRLPPTISTIDDIVYLLKNDFVDWKKYGEVYTNKLDYLTLFNYLPTAQYEDRWNYFETVSRGLILNNETGEVVARPFDKFFNWFQGGRKATGYFVNITEKIDGSCGILYRYNGQYKIATRGSFNSEQAIWATNFLNANYDLSGLPDEWTLIFEIVYPQNRIVVNYGDLEGLFLLAIRNRFTGEYFPFYNTVFDAANKYGFLLPSTHSFNNPTEILTVLGVLDENHEGFVVETSTGERWKFKGDKYLELHKFISSITKKNVLSIILDGKIDDYLSFMPAAFRDEANNVYNGIMREFHETKKEVDYYYKRLRVIRQRKDFAIQAKKEVPAGLLKFMFMLRDGNDITNEIFVYLQRTKEKR